MSYTLSQVSVTGSGIQCLTWEREASFVDIVQTVNIYTFCKYIVYIIQFSNLLLKTKYTAQCSVY